jgi:hypothetical protein
MGIVGTSLAKYFEGLIILDKLCDHILSHAMPDFIDRLHNRVIIS